MLESLAPLGRDGGGAWAGMAGRCGVAVAARLRHATPEDTIDSQPARSASGKLILVGDLRVDNRADLAPALRLRDSPSVPDSAFVLAAYERWGEALPDRILGEFALAVVDQVRGGVLLARDHVGFRPLVVHERRGTVAFATTALSLTGLEGIGHDLDVERAAEVLALVYESERTFVQGVRWLTSGGAMWVSAGGVRHWNWWKPDPHEIVELDSQSAYEDELRDALDKAVAARLRSSGRVGAGVSGGLDSTSVAATAALMLAPRALPTYTSAPLPGISLVLEPQRDADESPLVRRLAEKHQNIKPSFIHLRPGIDLFDVHRQLFELGAGPIRNPCNMLWIHAIHERAAQDRVTTLLTGARGNLGFSADGPDWLSWLVRAGRLKQAWSEAATWSAGHGESRFRLAVRQLETLAPGGVQRAVRAACGLPQPSAAWEAASALRPDVGTEFGLLTRASRLGGGRWEEARAAALAALQASGAQADTMAALAALTGVEERDPTGDRRVLEVAGHQPEWVRRRDGVGRAVVRGAMSDRQPAEIVLRTRRGEQLPEWLALMTSARAEVQAELSALETHAVSRALIDTGRLRALVDRWPPQTARCDPQVINEYRYALWRALNVSRYLRWFDSARVSHLDAAGSCLSS